VEKIYLYEIFKHYIYIRDFEPHKKEDNKKSKQKRNYQVDNAREIKYKVEERIKKQQLFIKDSKRDDEEADSELIVGVAKWINHTGLGEKVPSPSSSSSSSSSSSFLFLLLLLFLFFSLHLFFPLLFPSFSERTPRHLEITSQKKILSLLPVGHNISKVLSNVYYPSLSCFLNLFFL
jgi:hypothetical protein